MGVVYLRSPIALSLVFHLALVAALVATKAMDALHVNKPLRSVVEVEFAEFKRAPDVLLDRRIVQTEVVNSKKVEPKVKAYLGETTQSVERETVNKKRTTVSNSAQRRQAAPVLSPGLKSLGIPLFDATKHAMNSGEEIRRALDPKWEVGEALPQDYIKGIEESSRTVLNTKEYVFYGYFQRIRKQLDLAWNASLKEHLVKFYRRGRKLANDTDYLTQTLVTLNKMGDVVRVQILAESGTKDLDDAAVRAFNTAGPFPNPPSGITSPEGLIQIRWDFVLKN